MVIMSRADARHVVAAWQLFVITLVKLRIQCYILTDIALVNDFDCWALRKEAEGEAVGESGEN